MRARFATSLLATAFAALAAAACGERTVGPTGVSPTENFGRLRYVHAVRGATTADSLNVAVEDVPFAVNVAYGTSYPRPQGGFFPVYVGSRHLVVQRTADPTVTVFDTTITIADATDFTVVNLGSPADTGAFVIQEATTTSAPDASRVKLRAVHAAPMSGAVDVYVTAPGADLTTIQPTIAGLTLRQVSAYVTLSAGSYSVRFTTAGTKTVVATVVPNPPPSTSAVLAAGTVRTILLLDPATTSSTTLRGASLNDR